MDDLAATSKPPSKLNFWTDRGHENKVTRQVIRSLTKSVASIHKELRLGCIVCEVRRIGL